LANRLANRLYRVYEFLLYDLRKHHINALRYYLGVYDWSHILLNEDIQTVYDQFLNILRFYVRLCIPVRTVRAGRRDPDYISPYVKLLLAKRNRLRKRGHSAAADKLAYAINQIIATNMRNRLRKVTNAPIKEMWKALKLNNPERDSSSRIRHLLADTNRVNQYFANVSFDQAYNETAVEAERPSVFGATTAFKPLYAYEVETMLRKVSKTSPGCDNVPFWVFKLCSFELADAVAHIYNCSLRSGVLPRQWLSAIITPVPKVPTPSTLSDFRPISVTPILSRVIEKCVVTRWLRPAIPSELLADQFAFRPTGSTTCALVYFMHHVTNMLEHNAYVRCLLVDFSKAFDRVDHLILVSKLSELQISPFIFNWLISFLTGRSHTTRCFGVESCSMPINLSIVQGSVLGPTFYILLEGDLKPISSNNIIFKYADDTNLLVPEHTDVQLTDEFEAIRTWASDNKMVINISKTKEIVFRRPNPRLDVYLPTLPHIERITEAKLLGVVFSSTLHFDAHVNFVLKVCNQRSYLLRKFRDQGLSSAQLNIVFDAIILSRIMYASQSWSGFVSSELAGRIDSFFRRMFRYGLCQNLYSFCELADFRDLTLFNEIRHSNNCIHCLLPSEKSLAIPLRPRGHNFLLPMSKTNLHKHSFVTRCLYKLV
jgi:hypothetical protein